MKFIKSDYDIISFSKQANKTKYFLSRSCTSQNLDFFFRETPCQRNRNARKTSPSTCPCIPLNDCRSIDSVQWGLFMQPRNVYDGRVGKVD